MMCLLCGNGGSPLMRVRDATWSLACPTAARASSTARERGEARSSTARRESAAELRIARGGPARQSTRLTLYAMDVVRVPRRAIPGGNDPGECLGSLS